MRVRVSPWALVMTIPTHLLAGLIIGKITGEYPGAILGALVLDVDHLYSYIRHKVLRKPKVLWKTLIKEEDMWGDQRNILHALYVGVAVLEVTLFISSRTYYAFALGYFSHIILDAIDRSPYYPLFPFRGISITGFIPYGSRLEWIISSILCGIFSVLFFQ